MTTRAEHVGSAFAHQVAENLRGAPAQTGGFDVERTGAVIIALILFELGAAITAGARRQRMSHDGTGAAALIARELDHVV